MEQALKPCPFCGGSKIKHRLVETYSMDSSYYTLGCSDCGCFFYAEGPEVTPEDVKEWNRRATTTNVAKDVSNNRTPTTIEASPVVGEIEAVGDLIERLNIIAAHRCANDMGFDRETGPLGCALEAQPCGSCFCAGVIPAARQAAAFLASLQSENRALREKVERLAKGQAGKEAS